MKTKGMFVVGKREEEILKAVHFYRYMTALDVTRLLYSPSVITHVRTILTDLSGGGDYVNNQFLYRFPLQTGVGNRVRVYTLGAVGRKYLAEEVGLPTGWYFRPGKVRHLSAGWLLHNLLLTRVLIAGRLWARERPDFALREVRTCYEIETLYTQAETEKKVIPDAWMLFEQIEGQTQHEIPVLLEVDRGTTYRTRFKEHIRSRIGFVRDGGLYGRMFGRREVKVVYLTTGETSEYRQTRRRSMCAWAWEVLKETRRESWADVFRFGSVAFEEVYEGKLFTDRMWYRLGKNVPVGLFEG